MKQQGIESFFSLKKLYLRNSKFTFDNLVELSFVQAFAKKSMNYGRII